MMRNIYNILCGLLVLMLLVFGCISLFDKAPVSADAEDQPILTAPKLTFSGILTGSYVEDLVDYYNHTFPFRDKLLEGERIVSGFFDFTDLDEAEE